MGLWGWKLDIHGKFTQADRIQFRDAEDSRAEKDRFPR